LYAIIKAELNQIGRNFKEDICFSDFLNKFQTDHLGDLVNSILEKVKYDNIPVGKFTLSQYETSRTMWE